MEKWYMKFEEECGEITSTKSWIHRDKIVEKWENFLKSAYKLSLITPYEYKERMSDLEEAVKSQKEMTSRT